MANIRDVARRAGVSPTAVSFVLNGRHDQLSQETIERVERAMNELDYHPSAIAQGLATKRTGTI
ncbi:MAG TPA: LacI family DNA-binding transcriptional regulator, partial [Limnochordia bacterium]|nr:LacI family DNA-binding transcriptional regulator [Limnochordia bacterium]